jgi:hypothetical protein
VFERSYSLHYLAQFGPDYDVFALPSTAVPSSTAVWRQAGHGQQDPL